MSSGWPKRPKGWRSRMGCSQAGSAMKGLVMGVSMTPGHTQFTRIFGAHVRAIVRVRLTTPPFDAAYAGEREPPTMQYIDARFVIEPCPAAASASRAARETR